MTKKHPLTVCIKADIILQAEVALLATLLGATCSIAAWYDV